MYYGNKNVSFCIYAPFGRSWGGFWGVFSEEFSSSFSEEFSSIFFRGIFLQFFQRNFPPVFQRNFPLWISPQKCPEKHHVK